MTRPRLERNRLGCPGSKRGRLRSSLLLRLHKNRIVDLYVLLNFGELDDEVRVVDVMNEEWNLDAVDFPIIIVLGCARDFVCLISLFRAQEQSGARVKIK